MRFRRITFKNYRCFVDGSVSFEENNSKNINLLIGPNGGGKTELLFAFWWVLYGFDFRSLQNKEATPYALNCDAYRILEDGTDGLSNSCTVTLEIENNGTAIPSDRDTASLLEYGVSSALHQNGHNGIGCNEIDDIMRRYDGKVEIVSSPEKEFTVKYVLTFNRSNIVNIFNH